MKEITEGAVSTVPDDTKSNTTERLLGTAAIDKKAANHPEGSSSDTLFPAATSICVRHTGRDHPSCTNPSLL